MSSRRAIGFTLLEVLVTLAVFALLALATGRATRIHLSTWSILEEKSIAGILAANAVERERSSFQPSRMRQRETKHTIAGRTLRVKTTVKKTTAAGYLSITADVVREVDNSNVYHLESARYTFYEN